MEQLAKIQKELKAPKSQRNSFGNYNYRNCEDILEAVKPLLGNALVTLSDDIVQIGDRFYVKATASFWSDGLTLPVVVSAYARESLDKKGMDSAQITGAASSYARKYALNGLFLIDDTKDADSTNTHEKEERKEVKEKPLNKEEAFEKAKQAIADCKSIKECMVLEKRISTSLVLGEDQKIDLAFELQAKILTFDPTSD